MRGSFQFEVETQGGAKREKPSRRPDRDIDLRVLPTNIGYAVKRSAIARLPGGGGFNPPTLRDPQRVLDDVRQGYVSLDRAATDYGVIIDAETITVDEAATQARRQEMNA